MAGVAPDCVVESATVAEIGGVADEVVTGPLCVNSEVALSCTDFGWLTGNLLVKLLAERLSLSPQPSLKNAAWNEYDPLYTVDRLNAMVLFTCTLSIAAVKSINVLDAVSGRWT